MQFNRNEYLKGNYDLKSRDEKENAYYANIKEGLEWNNHIKTYVKKCLGDAIGTFEYPYQLVQPFTNIGSFIDLGLFTQAADYLSSLESDNVGFNANRILWIERLRSADDYEYQKSLNPNYKTFTIEQMIKDGTIQGYMQMTGKKIDITDEKDTEIKEESTQIDNDPPINFDEFKDEPYESDE